MLLPKLPGSRTADRLAEAGLEERRHRHTKVTFIQLQMQIPSKARTSIPVRLLKFSSFAGL